MILKKRKEKEKRERRQNNRKAMQIQKKKKKICQKKKTKPLRNGKNKIKQIKTETRKHTHVKEAKTGPDKTKSKRTTRQIELKNEIKQLGLILTKTHNLKTKPKQCAN